MISIEAIETVAAGLEGLDEVFVFVGGAIAGLYMDDTGSAEPRPTDDVDCIVKVTGRFAYHSLENDLRNAGFSHDTSQSSLICRWVYRGVTVDIMPVDEKILGFSNTWYDSGIETAVAYMLPSGRKIKILTFPCFLATKLEAHRNRGQTDIRMDSDLEDVLLVVDGYTKALKSIEESPVEVRSFIKDQFSQLLTRQDFLEAVECYLSHEGEERVKRALELVSSIAN